MKKGIFIIGVVVMLLGCRERSVVIEQTECFVQYESTDSIFANPERGLWRFTYLYPEHKELWENIDGNPLKVEDLKRWRKENFSLVYADVYLKSFRDRPFSEEALQNIHQQFAQIREAGLKCIVRFVYANYADEPDASLEMVLTHCEQLRPVLHENADIIAVLQAGFIGAWGEWHTSSNGLAVPEYENVILRKLLDVLPPKRMIQVRTPAYKMNLLGDDVPVSRTEAFSGVDIARIGHHNDCLLSNVTDSGTYRDSSDREYVVLDGEYVPVGGETCPPSDMEIADCIRGELEMRTYHWSFLNGFFYRGVLDNWRKQGCWEDIVRHLGYCITLTSGRYSENVAPGGTINLEVHLYNSGYASPYNSRLVEFVLKNEECSYKFVVDVDPRFWAPLEEQTILLSAGIPEDIPEGKYRLYLNLPDPEARLYNNPDFSIRLVNEGTWEEVSGYNDLKAEVEVNACVNSEKYNGNLFFRRIY